LTDDVKHYTEKYKLKSDMDSEVEVLGYGISLIILNGMMYFGIPACLIMIYKKHKPQYDMI